MDKILILDFGSQTTALIARRIRDEGVYTDIVSGDTTLSKDILQGVKGIILGGSPESVYAKGALPDQSIYKSGLPLLGICYGLQRMTSDLGGTVEPLAHKEYGGVEVRLNKAASETLNEKAAAFTAALTQSFTAWMSHGDTITKLASGFVEIAGSVTGFPAVLAHEKQPWFGLQFHPELTHSENGFEILKAFVFGVCECEKKLDNGKIFAKQRGNHPRKSKRRSCLTFNFRRSGLNSCSSLTFKDAKTASSAPDVHGYRPYAQGRNRSGK
ncbi:MAG: hypothetical protein Ta2G_08470 [Termitinemataceae bacterium]|nr:MAG: hypothetical protein Ta2G_08470 [Termitinemataceae bacterium]